MEIDIIEMELNKLNGKLDSTFKDDSALNAAASSLKEASFFINEGCCDNINFSE